MQAARATAISYYGSSHRSSYNNDSYTGSCISYSDSRFASYNAGSTGYNDGPPSQI